MEYEILVWCSGCGNKIATSENIHCDDCITVLEKENLELKDEVEGLKKDVDDLENQIERLEEKP